MNNNKKNGTVLYIGGFELPDKNAAAQRVVSNAKLFKHIGIDTVFVGVMKTPVDNCSILGTKKEVKGFTSFAVPYPTNPNQWFKYLCSAEPFIEVAETIEDLTAIVCYNFQSVALKKILDYCKKRSVKCIADVTEWYSGDGRSLPVKVLKKADTFYRMCIVQKQLSGLIVISKYLLNYYKECKNVIYLPPLTDLLSCAKLEKEKREELRLVYAGSPGLKDRIDLLIEAISHVKRPIKLDIIGISEEEYLLLHPEHVHKELFSDKIHFMGRIPHNDTLEYVRNADFSCFFRYEDRVTSAGFPTKFAEAISLGTPVLTNKSSNIADYIKNGQNGILLNELSVEEIANAIETAPKNIIVDPIIFNYMQYTDGVIELLTK